MFTYAKIIFAFFLVGLTACQAKEKIEIKKPSGDQTVFFVDVARTEEELSRGLMFVEEMPQNEGMIFLYPRPYPLRFWMKNTLISLDMLFFDETNTLIHIEHSATPHDLSSRGPEKPSCTVIEINGGEAKEQKIEIGSKLFTNLAHECLQSPVK